MDRQYSVWHVIRTGPIAVFLRPRVHVGDRLAALHHRQGDSVLLRTLSSLLLLLLSHSSFAAEPYRSRHQTPKRIDCGVDLSRLLTPIEEFKTKHLGPSLAADNQSFLRGWPKTKKPSLAKFYFYSDNAVFRSLRDDLFEDAEMAAAVESLYTRIFFRRLGADPILGGELTYSDYKKISLGFLHDSKVIREHLQHVEETTNRELKQELEAVPEIRSLLEKAPRKLSNPLKWHVAGFGPGPDQAAVAARLARVHLEEVERERIPIHDFSDPKLIEELLERGRKVEETRATIQKQTEWILGKNNRLLSPAGPSSRRSVLSEETLALVRQAESDTHSKESFIQELHSLLHIRYKRNLPVSLVAKIQEYYHFADTFTPSVFEPQEVVDLGLGKAGYDVVRVDVKKQNARNLFQLMSALANAAHTPGVKGADALNVAIHLAREGQTKASDAFDKRRNYFGAAVAAEHLAGDRSVWDSNGVMFSGDDGIFVSQSAIPQSKKRSLVARLSFRRGASDYRITFLPAHYYDSETPISPRRRSQYINTAEGLEKKLRKTLEKEGVPHERLKSLTIAVDLQPLVRRGAIVNLILGGRANQELAARIKMTLRRMLPSGFQPGVMDSAEPSLRLGKL